MSFLIYAEKNVLKKIAQESTVPLKITENTLEIASDNMHTWAELIALGAWQCDRDYLAKSCLKIWQNKSKRALPVNALSYLKDEIAARHKEAKKYVYLDLLRILCGKQSINMYGYVHFGAVNLKRFYQSLTNRLMRSLKQKEEEEAFIKALQLLVRAQVPQIPLVKIFLKKDGDFEMYDEKGNDLKREYLRELSLEERNSAGREDLMMSILISIVPAKVDIIIGECDDAKLSLLQAVFSDRINIV